MTRFLTPADCSRTGWHGSVRRVGPVVVWHMIREESLPCYGQRTGFGCNAIPAETCNTACFITLGTRRGIALTRKGADRAMDRLVTRIGHAENCPDGAA